MLRGPADGAQRAPAAYPADRVAHGEAARGSLLTRWMCSSQTAGEAELAQLRDVLHVRVSVAGTLHSFKYSQASPMNDPLVHECRGIILDCDADWAVVARPFAKFFNWGEPNAHAIDWASARAYEKIDGTLMIMFYHAGAWRVATTGSADANGPVVSSVQTRQGAVQPGAGAPGASATSAPGTFAELFWRVFRDELGLCLAPEREAEARGFTFLLELTHPLSRVVIAHARGGIHVLAAIRTFDAVELGPEEAAVRFFSVCEAGRPAIATPRVLADAAREGAPLDPVRLQALCLTHSPMRFEGLVVVDGAGRRVKLKHPGYVALHHLDNRFDARNLVQVVRMGEAAEFLTYFPAYADAFRSVAELYAALVDELEGDWARLATLPRKAFQVSVYESRLPDVLLALRAGQTPSVRAFLAAMELKQLLRLLGLSDVRTKKATAKSARHSAAAALATASPADAAPVSRAGSAAAARADARACTFATTDWFRHGSVNSRDRDVMYVVAGTALPEPSALAAFAKDAPPGEDRNVCVVHDGRVCAVYHGTADEVNNAILATFALHGENAGKTCPVRERVPRDALRKLVCALAACLGRAARVAALRTVAKDALHGRDLAARVGAMQHLARDGVFEQLSPDVNKALAFQLAQSLALASDGTELYSKDAITEHFGDEIGEFMRREPAPSPAAFARLRTLCAEYLAVWGTLVIVRQRQCARVSAAPDATSFVAQQCLRAPDGVRVVDMRTGECDELREM